MLKAKRALIGSTVLAASLAVAGCSTTYQQMDYTDEGIVYGTLAGATLGAGVGLLIGGVVANALSAPIGAVVGGVTGGIIGYMMDQPQITTLQVPFRYDNAIIEPQYYPQLDAVVAQLREWPDTTINIDGHADKTGSSSYNMSLAELRAQSVQAYFERHGIAPNRITITSYGDTAPIADNATDTGRALNREAKVIPNDN